MAGTFSILETNLKIAKINVYACDVAHITWLCERPITIVGVEIIRRYIPHTFQDQKTQVPVLVLFQLNMNIPPIVNRRSFLQIKSRPCQYQKMEQYQQSPLCVVLVSVVDR